MAGVPGKNKIERGFRFMCDNAAAALRDLSGDLIPGSVNGGGKTLDEVDMLGVSESVFNYLAGHGHAPISASFHMNDLADTGETTNGAFTVINLIQGLVGTLALEYGSNGAAPSTGDPVWSGEYVCLGFTTSFSGGKSVINVSWQPSGAVAPAWSTHA
jgi:hypothetical protein